MVESARARREFVLRRTHVNSVAVAARERKSDIVQHCARGTLTLAILRADNNRLR